MAESGGGSREQQLTLKVMRLTRPSFAPLPGLALDPAAPPHLSAAPLSAGLVSVHGHPDLGLPVGQSLLLPQNFENIYLGETFTCYVCVHNEGAAPVTAVSLKADLQTSSQRVSLPSRYAEGVPELAPGGSLGEILTYEVNHQGQHILVCAVQYTNPAGEKQYFRKFFKFPVAKPLDVRTKFYNAEVGTPAVVTLCLAVSLRKAWPVSIPGQHGKCAKLVRPPEAVRLSSPPKALSLSHF